MGYILCAVTEKGGSGKSTLVTNVAVQWAQEGKKVLVLDLDPQKSSATWSQMRHAQEDELVEVEVAYIEGNMLGKILSNLKDDYDVIFLDVPGSDNGLLRTALMQADLAVIPFTTGGFDFLTSSHTLDVLKEAQQLRLDVPQLTPLKSAFFLNKTKPNSIGTRGLRNHFAEVLEHVVPCQAEFGYLDDFWGAAQAGMGVVEFNKSGRSARQVRKLASELAEMLFEEENV